MDSKIIVNHFAPDQSIEDSLKFLEGDGEVANEDMGAPNGNDVEGVDTEVYSDVEPKGEDNDNSETKIYSRLRGRASSVYENPECD